MNGVLAFHDEGDIVVAALEGPEVTSEVGERLRKKLDDQPSSDFILDLSKVQHLCSIGVGILVTFLKHIRAQGRRMALVGMDKHSRDVLEVVGLTRIFQTYPDVSAALDAMRLPRAQIPN